MFVFRSAMPRRDDTPSLYPNYASADELVGRFGLDRTLAETIVRHRPYRGVDDLLRIADLPRRIAPADLFVLIGESARTLPQPARLPVVERLSETDQGSGIVYGIAVDVAGERRAFLADGTGNEIAGAALAPGGTTPIDLASLRLGGYAPYELLRLHPLDRSRVRDYLGSQAVAMAAGLWRRLLEQWTRLDVTEARAVAWLSQCVAGAVDITRAHVRRRASMIDGGLPVVTPDVDWWDGDPVAPYEPARGDLTRRMAEDALFERIRRRGGPHHPLIAVQFALLREALTAIDPVAGPMPIAIAVPPVVRYDVPGTEGDGAIGRVVVKLVDVAYHGDDIGADWTYTVAVEDVAVKVLAAGTHHHGVVRTYDRVVHDGSGPDRYGSSFHLALQVSAREHDVMWDDIGAAHVNLLVACDPAYPMLSYRTEVTVGVRDRRWYGAGRRTARLRFTFEVETSCSQA